MLGHVHCVYCSRLTAPDNGIGTIEILLMMEYLEQDVEMEANRLHFTSQRPYGQHQVLCQSVSGFMHLQQHHILWIEVFLISCSQGSALQNSYFRLACRFSLQLSSHEFWTLKVLYTNNILCLILIRPADCLSKVRYAYTQAYSQAGLDIDNSLLQCGSMQAQSQALSVNVLLHGGCVKEFHSNEGCFDHWLLLNEFWRK